MLVVGRSLREKYDDSLRSSELRLSNEKCSLLFDGFEPENVKFERQGRLET